MAEQAPGELSAEEITLREIEDLNKRKAQIKKGYSTYIDKHPEIKTVVNGFMTAALLEKPENIFEFARTHFSGLQAEYAPQDAGTLHPLVITGPPGVGKQTLVQRLQKVCPEQFIAPLRHVTRKKAAIEDDGVDAHFVNKERITSDYQTGRVFHVEQDPGSGDLSALSFAAVDDVLNSGRVPVLILPVASYKKLVASGHYRVLRSVFIRPHEQQDLLNRLLERGTDSQEVMTQKMAQAEDDLLYCKAQQQVGGFERIIVNATFLVATGELKNACVDWYPHVERFMLHHHPDDA